MGWFDGKAFCKTERAQLGNLHGKSLHCLRRCTAGFGVRCAAAGTHRQFSVVSERCYRHRSFVAKRTPAPWGHKKARSGVEMYMC